MSATTPQSILALDIGGKRIGVARGSAVAKLPQPLTTITVDGKEIEHIKRVIDEYDVDTLVIGWPRNLSGQETAQTEIVAAFVKKLEPLDVTLVKQDETLTSVQAERELGNGRHQREAGHIDARAAVIILEDYLRTLS